jgi:hypothetical protein
VRAEQAGPFLPRERDQWPSRRRQPLPPCCGLGPRQFPQQPTRTISTYGRRCLAPARIQSLGILSSWRGSHLRGWDGRRLHRHIVDIQSPSNQHHAGKQYCQHCGEQLVDLVHYASPTARDILPTQQNVAPWIKFRTGLLRTFSNCPVRSARHFVRHGKASREQSCFPALPESRPLSSIASPCPSSGLPPAAMRSSSSLTLRTASTGRAHPCFGQTRAKSRIDQINRVDGSAR